MDSPNGYKRPDAGRFGGYTYLASSKVSQAIADDILFEADAVAGAISGSTSFAFSTSGTLTGSGALSGSSSPAFTTAGILTGTGALSGAASFAFTTSAAGTLVGALSGNSAFAFATAGTLAGSSQLVGSTSSTFTTSATLTGVGALSGSSDFAFATSGTLDGGAPASGEISGSTSFAFTASGTLTAVEAPVTPPVEAVSSGGAPSKSGRPPVPRHLRDLVFRNDPSPVDADAPDGPAAPVLGDDAPARLPASSPLSPEAVEALSAALAGGEVASSSPPVPLGAIALQPGNDDEEALMMILALAA